MKYTLYQRDWYFNAGIAGFMRVLCDGNIHEAEGVFECGENSITFEDTALSDFEEKFIKHAFLALFRITPFITKLEYLIKEIEKDTTGKKKPEFFIKKIGKTYNALYDILELSFTLTSMDDLTESIQKNIKRLDEYTEEHLYAHLNSFDKGAEYINSVVNSKLKGISGCSKIKDYIKALLNHDPHAIKEKDVCLFCQEQKAQFDFNNAVSNIIGFNNDNANWIWGYRTQNARLCGLCALIYSCSILSFAHVIKFVDSEYLNYLYFINHNTSIERMYTEIEEFKILLHKDTYHSFYEMIKAGISIIQTSRMNKIDENINFIEVVDNPIMGGQSTKGYNIYNYNIDKYIAGFLKSKLPDNIPKGYYSINKLSINIEEELLKLTITNQLTYNTLGRYFSYKISKSTTIKAVFNLPRVTQYIIDFINQSKGGDVDRNKSFGRGFSSGKELRELMLKEKKENQINGIAYGMLNSLKIADREKFLDMYIRLMMAYKKPVRVYKEEMTDKDSFLQFGYSFINGLLAEGKKKETEEAQA